MTSRLRIFCRDNSAWTPFDGCPVTSSRLVSFQARFRSLTRPKRTWNNPASMHLLRRWAESAAQSHDGAATSHATALSHRNGIKSVDADRTSYYAQRYGKDVPPAAGDLLLLAESSSMLFKVFGASADHFPSPVFRAQFVNLAHACSSVEKVLSGSLAW